MNFRTIAFAAAFIFLFGSNYVVVSQTRNTASPIETTISTLIESPGKFDSKRVHVFASLHTDGLHLSILKEPNCGLFDGTSKEPPPNQPQCARAIAAADSTNNRKNKVDQALAQAFAKGQRDTSDKHITAQFTGIFRCVPSCALPKHLELEIERTENVNVVMKDNKPHRPTS